MNIFDSPATVPLLIALVALIPAILGWIRSRDVDEVAAEAGSITRVIDGLNTLTKNLQDDNTILRGEIETLQARIQTLTDNYEKLKQEFLAFRNSLGK